MQTTKIMSSSKKFGSVSRLFQTSFPVTIVRGLGGPWPPDFWLASSLAPQLCD